MAYWWVNQKLTFAQDRVGGFLWTPQVDRGGHCPQHWRNLSLIQAGDVLFSIVDFEVASVLIAGENAHANPVPIEAAHVHGNDDTNAPGWLVMVGYRDLHPRFPLGPVQADFRVFVPPPYSPLNKNGTPNNGFIFALPPRAGRFLLDLVDNPENPPEVEALQNSILLDVTERQALIQSRIGQGRFRREVLAHWHGRCAVSGLDLEILLRASHIKPWKDANNEERLDPFNGLLLGPSYDAAFDQGLITFRNDGTLVLWSGMSAERCRKVGIDPDARLANLAAGHLAFLDYHRRNVFKLR